MAKSGRPGIPYEQFVATWEQLMEEGRAGTNAAHDILGGSKGTIAAYRERYEREKSSKELAFIKSVELSDAVHKAIAEVKVKELEALEKINVQLKTRLDENLNTLKETEGALASSKVDLDDAKAQFESERLSFERKLAAAQARIEDLEKREQKIIAQNEALSQECNHAKQESAVAKKEAEMLREQLGKK